ncbi:type IV secretion system protein VirB2 [Phenylobacterium haematophilum]|jgi:type IV secretory pathway VirB2 component (pilin)|uniref:Type IV secretion system protein VirB2 n=2 Tax=Caulobacteraceae TaxID=76892 RepID=A0A840A1S1_9CAUL|nr:TrbC/VirB2 family protein [Phenylobacterium haematophilum]MBB3892895.1 type IV secretion system protein VirB2 [Phenylobacterium haematophilum]
MAFTSFSAAEGRCNLRTAVMVAGIAMLVAGPAWAAGGGTAMPWETPLETIMQSLSGPVAKAVGIIAIVLTGLGFAFSEGGSVLRRGIGIVFGLAIAFTATTFITSFFNMTAGAAF